MSSSSATTTTTPSSALESSLSKYLARATSIYRSSRSHPRYHARIYSLSAIAVGGLLNILTFVAALFEHYENAPIVVAFWVGFVVSFFFLFFFCLSLSPILFFSFFTGFFSSSGPCFFFIFVKYKLPSGVCVCERELAICVCFEKKIIDED